MKKLIIKHFWYQVKPKEINKLEKKKMIWERVEKNGLSRDLILRMLRIILNFSLKTLTYGI